MISRRTYEMVLPVVLTLAFGVGHRECSAQIGYTPESIEWLTASSDVVVVAAVEQLEYRDRRPAAGETQVHWQWVTVTLRTATVLKGKPPETIVFTIEQARGMETLPQWKASEQPVIWFLVESERDQNLPPDRARRRRGGLRLRCEGSRFVNTSAIELSRRRPEKRVRYPVFSMDFRVLAENEQILDAVRTEAERKIDQPLRALQLPMPRTIAEQSGRSGDVNALMVPVNTRLEELGRTWIRSEMEWLRKAGEMVLAEFKVDNQ